MQVTATPHIRPQDLPLDAKNFLNPCKAEGPQYQILRCLLDIHLQYKSRILGVATNHSVDIHRPNPQTRSFF